MAYTEGALIKSNSNREEEKNWTDQLRMLMTRILAARLPLSIDLIRQPPTLQRILIDPSLRCEIIRRTSHIDDPHITSGDGLCSGKENWEEMLHRDEMRE